MPALSRLLPNRHPLRLLWHRARAFVAALRYGFPGRKLLVIGITGTDGKTTTVGMTAHILHEAGMKVGALSTAFFRMGKDITWNKTQKTSPSPFIIQQFLRRLADEGYTHAVLECSSHGLVQGRLNHTHPSIAAITNTAMEHLDYHGTMEQYRKDKGILFQMLKGKGTKVLNGEDETARLYDRIPSEHTILYTAGARSTLKGDRKLWVEKIKEKESVTAQLEADVKGTHISHPLILGIPGRFNLENALCAIACTYACRIPIEVGVDSLKSFRGIPGRMEKIDEGQRFSVYIDFTVTPQAFEKTLTTLRPMLAPHKRILVLTGSCGDRMREKRPLVGKICSELADVVVITDDESYTEDPKTVMEEVWAGVNQKKTEAYKVFDRKEAIQLILSKAKAGDIVLLCGLGSYPSRMTPKGPIPWNEQEITRKLLRSLR